MKTTTTKLAEIETLIAVGVPEETAASLAGVSVEARFRGFAGHLPPADISAWGPELEEAGLGDLADRARALDPG